MLLYEGRARAICVNAQCPQCRLYTWDDASFQKAFDEFLTDPDPLLVQIGAVLLDLSATLRIADTLNVLVTPRDRKGWICGLDP